MKKILIALSLLLFSGCMRIDPGTGAALVTLPEVNADFTNVPLGQTRTKTFSLKNTGGFDASKVTISAVSSPFILSTNTCLANLAVGEACTISLGFTPTAAGAVSLLVTITYDTGDGNASLGIMLEGSGSMAEMPPP